MRLPCSIDLNKLCAYQSAGRLLARVRVKCVHACLSMYMRTCAHAMHVQVWGHARGEFGAGEGWATREPRTQT